MKFNVNHELSDKDRETAKTCIALFNEFESHRITKNEFYTAQVDISLSCLDEYRYRPYPTIPVEVHNYYQSKKSYAWEHMAPSAKRQVSADIYLRYNKYFSERDQIYVRNNSNMHWLIKVHRFLKCFKQEGRAQSVAVLLRQHLDNQSQEGDLCRS